MKLKASAASLAAVFAALVDGAFSTRPVASLEELAQEDVLSLLAISSRLHQQAKPTKGGLQSKKADPDDPTLGGYQTLGLKVHVKGAGSDVVNGRYTRCMPYLLDDGAIVVATTFNAEWVMAYYPASAKGYGPAWYIQRPKGLKGAYLKRLDKDPEDLNDLRIPDKGWVPYQDGSKYALPGYDPPPSVTFDTSPTQYVWTAKGAAFANSLHGTPFTAGSDVPQDYVDRAMYEFGVQSPLKKTRDKSRWLMIEKDGANDVDAVNNLVDLTKQPFVEGQEWKLGTKKLKEPVGERAVKTAQEAKRRFRRKMLKGYVDQANAEFQTPWLWMDSPQGWQMKLINDYRKGLVNLTMSTFYELASGDREAAVNALNELMTMTQPKTPEGHKAFVKAADLFSKMYTKREHAKMKFQTNQRMAQAMQYRAPRYHASAARLHYKFQKALRKVNKVKLKLGHAVFNGGG
jgi:hypothetical protein